jgi:hypothetical protein
MRLLSAFGRLPLAMFTSSRMRRSVGRFPAAPKQ